METVEVVIRLPQNLYLDVKNGYASNIQRERVIEQVKNGTVLPERHGRLVDADAILEDPYGNTYKDIDIAETIIEADKEGERMSLHITNMEIEKLVNQLGYKGCKNCEDQISPLRMCEWAEQGGDGAIHFICPKWRKKGVSE